MMNFSSTNARDSFLAHEGVRSWFKEINPWTKDFKVLERLIWIDVEGVPFKAWCPKSFSLIARKWGEVVFMDDSDGNNLYSSRICIKSSYLSLIFETVKVILDGCIHHVRVKEVCGWIPDFLEDDTTSKEEEGEGSAHVDREPSHGVQLSEDDDLSGIQDTFQHEEVPKQDNAGAFNNLQVNEERDDDDPFGIFRLLENNPALNVSTHYSGESATPTYPPGYTPHSEEIPLVDELIGAVMLITSHKLNLSSVPHQHSVSLRQVHRKLKLSRERGK